MELTEIQEKIETFKKAVEKSKSIVFIGGAGVSTESGIPDFRSSGGVYSNKKYGLSPEEMISHDYFMYSPEGFYDFYKKEMLFPDAKPNDAHKGLAHLENEGKLKAVVTQNIDGLHQAAGSKAVYELHGSVHRNYCMKCHKFFPLSYIMKSDGVPYCDKCGGLIKPDVVLYGESLDQDILMGSCDAISKADMLIIGGTSLVVYPAASLYRYFSGDTLVVINKSETQADRLANIVINDSIGKVFRSLTKK
ncbi:MAG: NAD-dependent protein deacylase [Clostridia bacterium]|nr:NAD-dependent protein deacylase [Clostridia bacterium]